jgi:hypothetical protein
MWERDKEVVAPQILKSQCDGHVNQYMRKCPSPLPLRMILHSRSMMAMRHRDLANMQSWIFLSRKFMGNGNFSLPDVRKIFFFARLFVALEIHSIR